MNEHGVSIAETSLGRTAREAIRVIGALAEEYGCHSSFPIDGEQLAIGDGAEIWTMEIFGPGPDWTPDSNEPGAVWCAQRVTWGSRPIEVALARSTWRVPTDSSRRRMCSRCPSFRRSEEVLDLRE